MKCIECEICGKKFYDRGQKYKPQYQLTEHRKSCMRLFKKKQFRECKDWLLNRATELDINRLYLYIKNPNEGIIIDKPITPEPEITRQDVSSAEPVSDDNCEYEKEYLHETYSDTSDSDRASSASPERPASDTLSPWYCERSKLNYLIDKDENVYLPNNKTLLGVRKPIQIKKQDEIINTYKIVFV